MFFKKFINIKILFNSFFLEIMIIIFPFGGNIKFAKYLENIIEGKEYYKIKNFNFFKYILFLIILILFSPFIIRQRYQLINFSAKIYMLFFTLYPLIFQIIFSNQFMVFMVIHFLYL